MDLRLRSNEARQPFPRKPGRVFWLRPALAPPSQPAAGLLVPVRKHPRRLGQRQNLSTQDPTQFSDRLLANDLVLQERARLACGVRRRA